MDPHNPMKSLKSLLQSLALLAFSALVVGLLVWFFVEALLGGTQ